MHLPVCGDFSSGRDDVRHLQLQLLFLHVTDTVIGLAANSDLKSRLELRQEMSPEVRLADNLGN